MARIEAMLREVRADRRWYHDEARKTSPWNHGMLIDAAACAIREKALADALEAIRAERR